LCKIRNKAVIKKFKKESLKSKQTGIITQIAYLIQASILPRQAK